MAYREQPYNVRTSTDDYPVLVDMKFGFYAACSELCRETLVLWPSTGARTFKGATLVGFLANVVGMPRDARLRFVPAPKGRETDAGE